MESKITDLYLSKSSLETYVACASKFDRRYVQKLPGFQAEKDRQASLFGNLIHSILEEYFKKEKKVDLEELYKEEFSKSDITSQEFFFLGSRLLADYAKSVDKGNKVLSLEQGFQLYLGNGTPVKGFIDRIDELSEDEIEIVDYKTGYSPPMTGEELEKDLQLGIYNLAVNQLYPKYKKVKLSLDYLHYGRVSCYRSPQQLKDLEDYLGAMYSKIITAIEEKKEFKTTVNSYCSFCDYKKDCKDFQNTIKKADDATLIEKTMVGLIAPETGLTVELDKVDVFLKLVQAKQKILKKVELEVKDFIKQYIKDNGGEKREARIGSTYYSLNSKKYTNYEIKTILELCEKFDVDPSIVLSPNKGNIDKVFKGNNEAMKKLNETSNLDYSESFVK